MNTQKFTQFAQQKGFRFITDFREVEGSQVAHIAGPRGEQYAVRAFDLEGQTRFQFQPLTGPLIQQGKFILAQEGLDVALQTLGQDAMKFMALKQAGIGLMAAFTQESPPTLPLPQMGVSNYLKNKSISRKIFTAQGVKEVLKNRYRKIKSAAELGLLQSSADMRLQEATRQEAVKLAATQKILGKQENQHQEEQQQQEQNRQIQQSRQQQTSLQIGGQKKKKSKFFRYFLFGASGSAIGLIGGPTLFTVLFGK